MHTNVKKVEDQCPTSAMMDLPTETPKQCYTNSAKQTVLGTGGPHGAKILLSEASVRCRWLSRKGSKCATLVRVYIA